MNTPVNDAFTVGLPDLREFPFNAWNRILRRVQHRRDPAPYGFAPARGDPELREQLAAYLKSARAIDCHPEQILITAGAQQALDLIARLLAGHHDTIAMENPGYSGARSVFAMSGARLLPVSVDEEGLVVEALYPYGDIKLVYTTPSHQYPLGYTLSVGRRIELLKWAQQTATWIVEDDYDSEYHYHSRPIPSLYGLDRNGHVIYTGSFSKVLFPALRLGYLVLPEAIAETASAVKQSVYGAQPMTEQLAVAEFMREGHFSSHLKRMRNLYRKKMLLLRERLTNAAGDRVRILDSTSGMHLTVVFAAEINDVEVAHRLLEQGYGASPLSSYDLEARCKGLVLGFAGASHERLAYGAEAIARVLRQPPYENPRTADLK